MAGEGLKFPFRKGDRVVLIECPPPSFGYSDYTATRGYFEGWSDIGGFTVSIRDLRGVVKVINMQASTIIELRGPYEYEQEQWDQHGGR